MNELDTILWRIIADVPNGKVTTYGTVARLAGYPSHARYVGRVLKRLPADTQLPWHRIVSAGGRVAFSSGSHSYRLQTQRLQAEGVFICDGKISLAEFGWPQSSNLSSGAPENNTSK